MSSNVATLFYTAPNCIDLAYVSECGAPIGHSMTPNILVTGQVEGDEQVVCDFSTLKGTLKSIMDGAFDHRLVIFKKNGKLIGVDTLEYVESSFPASHYFIVLSNTKIEINLPSDAVRIIELEDDSEIPVAALRRYLKQSFDGILSAEYGFKISTEVKEALISAPLPSINVATPNLITFNYVHGLKNSSSFGCKNIVHGHTSFIQFEYKNPAKAYFELDSKFNEEFDELDNSLRNILFVYSDNVVAKEGSKVTIEYTTQARGLMRLVIDPSTVNPNLGFHLEILETETTAENLINFFHDMIRSKCPTIYKELKHIYASEGLMKGCVIKCD